jgi:hypothetical protein
MSIVYMENHMEISHTSQDLANFVDHMIEAIGSGRLGFDDAVREYVDKQPGTIGAALQHYVQALAAIGKEPDSETARMDARRTELRAFAGRLNTPEAFTLAEALIKSQDQRISLLKTLEGLKSN